MNAPKQDKLYNPVPPTVKKITKKKLKALNLWASGFYRLTQVGSLYIVKWLLKSWCGLTFQGQHQLTSLSQCILAPTHYSHLDFWTVLAALPLTLRKQTYVAAAKDHFYHHPLRYLTTKLASYNNFPFERNNLTPSGYQQLIKILQAGCSLLMFPQGTRSRDGKVKPFKSLLALLAVETQLPVVPVFIQGTFEALPAGKVIIKRHPIHVVYGKPLTPPIVSDYRDRKQLLKQARQFNEEIMDEIERALKSQEK